ncbi:MAG: 2-dehydropantoate 2-reductase [Burkholderiales bacterium]|nr:2-dehydropantoate 2-reductase [Burkholderiales bacterium]
MKIAVFGAGAIGGYLGARLAAAGEQVSFIARGANLAAIRANGLRLLLEDGGEIVAKDARACGSAAEAGPQDAVLLTLKAHQVTPVAAEIAALCGDSATLVTMQNGIPWWYFQKHGGPYEGTPVRTADPDGSIARLIDPARIVGSVVFPAAMLVAPGVVQVVEGNRFTLGELDGAATPRVQALAAALVRAGFKAPITRDIRGEIWVKLWGNLSFNPISALTHATLEDICRFAPTRELAAEMMREAQAVAGKLGVGLRVSLERRIAGAEKVGAHKTSMLQDVEQGRPIEIEALLGSAIELGELTQTPTPCMRSVYACARLLAQTLDRAKGRLRVQGA